MEIRVLGDLKFMGFLNHDLGLVSCAKAFEEKERMKLISEFIRKNHIKVKIKQELNDSLKQEYAIYFQDAEPD